MTAWMLHSFQKVGGIFLAFFLCFIFFAQALFASEISSTSPKHIVSLDLCTDQYILGLVPKNRISAVSIDAHNSTVSLFAHKAESLPTVPNDIEKILQLNPDLVVVPKWSMPKTVQLLRYLNIPILEITPTNTKENIIQETRRIAKILNVSQKAEEEITHFQARFKDIENISQKQQRPLAAYYIPGGFTSGHNSFVDLVMKASGFNNLASQLGYGGFGSLSLETLILNQPDYFIFSYFDDNKPSLAKRLKQHSALQNMVKNTKQINLPGKYWSCSGWFLYYAIDYLRQAKS